MELRVHGVSGTPPQDLLNRPLVAQIAGDRIAGFYRPRLLAERFDSAPDPSVEAGPADPELVGYSWGGLTSGSPGRALWLLLLPFTLINIAPRARPPYRSATDRLTWLTWYLCRLLALSMTMLLVIAAIGIGGDLIGWQCAEGNSCAKASPAWVFHGLSKQHHLSVEHMLLVGSSVPVALLSLLWLAAASTANRYESTIADVPAAAGLLVDDESGRTEPELASRWMWQNAHPVRRLRAIHIQCGFALILWTVAAPTEPGWRHAGGWSDVRSHPMLVLAAAIVLYGVIALASSRYTGRRHSAGRPVVAAIAWTLLAVGALWTASGLLDGTASVDSDFIVSTGRDRLPVGGLPYFAMTALVICGCALLLLLLLAVVVCGTAWFGRTEVEVPEPHQPLAPALHGLTTAGLAALAVFLAAAFSAGSYNFAATWLNTGSLKPSYGEASRIYQHFTLPPVLTTATLAYTFSVAGLVVLLLLWLARIGLGLLFPRNQKPFAADYRLPLDPRSAKDAKRRSKKIRRDMFLGGLVDQVPWFAGPMVLIGVVIVAIFATLLGRHPRKPVVELFGATHGWRSPLALSGVGSYLVVITIVALIAVGTAVYRVPATRRVVGILWDVAAFWPRTCHPLAPPCYAERAVPDLVTFITHERLTNPQGVVVLAAHSQGTVISAATIIQLRTFDEYVHHEDTGTLSRVGFLSFGCVLRRLYGRYFPAYFGPEQLAGLQRILSDPPDPRPRWRNLWRYTDYLGGQVVAGPPCTIPASDPATAGGPVLGPYVDWEQHSPDPPSFDRPAGDTVYPKTLRHSDFWIDKSGYFQDAVRSLIAQTRQRDRH
jgi:hypothetical protein